MKKIPSKINAKTLFELYRNMFEQEFDVEPPRFNLKDLSLLKKLIDEQGKKQSYKYIVRCIKRWSLLKKEFNIYGYPTIGVLWGFRFSFFEHLTRLRKNSVSYEKESKSKKNHSKKLFFSS